VVGVAGRNLVIGSNGWFLEGSTGSDEVSGDLAVPLEMDDEERGEFTEWLLYRDGEVVTTVTEDQIDAPNDALLGLSTSTLSNPIGADVRRTHPRALLHVRAQQDRQCAQRPAHTRLLSHSMQ